MQKEGMPMGQAMVAGGAMATLYVMGRVVGTPLVGKLSDILLKRLNTPRSVVMMGGLLGIAAMFYAYTTPIGSAVWLGVLAFYSGIVVNIFPLVNASAAEIWSIRTAGFSMGIINTVGQLAGALALSVSGYMAVKYSVKGGAFYTEFLGIWYLGIITSLLAASAALYVIYREKQAVKEHAAVLTGKDGK
jgi:MFS family permease